MCFISADLFTCESLGSESNVSITFDGEVSVGRGSKRSTQNHSSLCAECLLKYNYLEIRFNHFYDVCAVTTWTKNSNHTLANFRIQYSNSMTSWSYYRERAIVKVSNYLSNLVGVAFVNYHLCQAYAKIPQGHVGSFESTCNSGTTNKWMLLSTVASLGSDYCRSFICQNVVQKMFIFIYATCFQISHQNYKIIPVDAEFLVSFKFLPMCAPIEAPTTWLPCSLPLASQGGLMWATIK